VTVNATPAAPTATSNSPICEGDDLNLSVTNIAGATYSWTGPNGFTSTNQNPTIFGVTAAESGAYSVTANVAGCPSAAATTAVTVNPIPATPVPSSNSPICIGQTINLSNAAVVGAAYNWTGPNGFTSSIQSPSITNATATEAGTYSLTVTVNGCTSSAATVTVAVNTAPGTPTAGSNSPLCVGEDLNLTSSTIAGATYSWTGPNGFTSTQQNPTITGITAAGAGTYTVIADNGCASSPADVSVTVNPTPAALTLGSNSPICEGDDILLDANTIAGGTYDWTGPNGVTSSQEDPIVNGATTADGGVYSATVTVNGCMSVPATTTVTVNPIPAAPSIGSNSPVCEFYDLNLDAGTVPGATYNWTGPNGFTSALEDPTITGITSAGAGTYNVTITVLGCESAPASTSVTVEPTPATPTASSNSPICEGGQLDLSASNVVGTTYDWTGPNGYSSSQQNPSINPVSAADAGIYSVTATSTTNGCVSFPGTVNVTILAIPSSPSITSNSPVCIGDDITLSTTAVAGATYNWTGPNGFTSAMQNPTITGSTLADAGFYYLTIEVNGCISNTDSIEVFVNDQPVTPVASNNGPICEFETLEIFVDTIPGAVYSWIGPNGFTSTDQNPSIPLATAGEAGTYTVIADNGCSSNPASTSVTINPSPGTPVVGSNSPVCVGDDIDLTASTVGGSTFTWTGPNGYSSIQQNPTIGGATTADAGFYSVYATESGCDGLPDSVEVVVTEPPVADAGGDQVACANNATITLNGSITGGTGAGVWTTSGNGSFSPSVNDLNADYVPSPADTAAGSITITLASINNAGCPASSDDMVLTITPSPAVEAGPDATICSNNAVVDLTGVVTAGATSGIWTSNGSGSFSPSDTDLGADYNATPADTAAGSFMIYLTSTNNGNCLAVSDSLEVTVIASPIADAGADQFVCDGDDVFLVGSITNGSGNGTWTTSGAGTFIPSATDLNATYEPDPTDYAIGSVVLTLTSTGSGSCLEEADSILITFTPPPTVNPGNDTNICSNEDLALSGLVSGATTTGIWATSGDGTFSPSDTDLNAIYNPGLGDASAGTITLTLTATNGCPSSAGIAVTITPGPTADAGPDQVLCATDDQVTLSGVIGGSTTTGEWSTTGDGSFTPTNNALNGTYIIGLNDSISGSFDLILSSTNNGVCAAEMDTMSVTITTLPVVNAGIDTTICTNNLIDLYGLVSGGAGTGQWSTAGSGTFNPVSTDLNATYIPSPADITAGSVVLTLTSTGACAIVDDQMTMAITPGPEVDAGVDQTICETSIATLVGTLSGTATSAEWSTNGTGGFDPSITDLNADYIPSAADITAGTIEIYLTSTNNGLCIADVDTMVLTIGAGPIVDAGPDQGVCIGSNAPLSGSITGVTSTGQWSTLGDGSFTPNDTDLNGSYIPGVNDTTNGSVQLVLTSTNNAGCVADSDTLELTFETAPFIDAGPDVTVCGNADTVDLAGLISGAITTGYWSTTGDGIFDSDTTILINTYYPGSLDSTGGGVQLLLYASGLSTCTPDPDTVNVTITAVPVVDAGGDQSICSSSLTVNLNGAVSGGSNSGIWTTDGSGVFAPDNTDLNGTYDPSTADTTAGSITMVLTSTNNGLCLAVSDSISVTFDDIPQANAGLDMTGCANDSLALSGVISGGGSSMWYTTNGNGTFSDSSALNAAYLPDSLDPSNSPIEIILEYTNGCGVDTDTLFADVYAVPVADFAFLQTCESDSIQFTDNSSVDVGSIISWNWDLGTGEVSSIINPTGYYDTLGNFTISLVVESDMGCTDSTSQSITVVPLPNAHMWVSDTVVLPGDIIDFIDTSDYAVSWEWYFGDGSDSVQVEDTLYAYTNPGTYEVILVVENSQGCTDTAFQLITVESDSIADVFPPAFPTAFTPNGDGLNDVFYVRGGPFSEFELRIFNEWGNEIFTSNGQQIGWDGTKSGSPQPDGLYIYVFKGEGIDGEVYDISGEINIIR
jgi:gliding motility-associated-like protein